MSDPPTSDDTDSDADVSLTTTRRVFMIAGTSTSLLTGGCIHSQPDPEPTPDPSPDPDPEPDPAPSTVQLTTGGVAETVPGVLLNGEVESIGEYERLYTQFLIREVPN